MYMLSEKQISTKWSPIEMSLYANQDYNSCIQFHAICMRQMKMEDVEDFRHSKNRKTVSFKRNGQLVRVKAISPRTASPLSQELTPCDPQKLMQDQVKFPPLGIHKLRDNSERTFVNGSSGLGMKSSHFSRGNTISLYSNIHTTLATEDKSNGSKIHQIYPSGKDSHVSIRVKTTSPQGVTAHSNVQKNTVIHGTSRKKFMNPDLKVKYALSQDKYFVSFAFNDNILPPICHNNMESMSPGNKVHTSPYKQSSMIGGKTLWGIQMRSGNTKISFAESQPDPQELSNKR